MIHSGLWAEVAAAVGLREGEAGVRAVVRSIVRNEPVAVGTVARETAIPIPLVTAVCGELRTRGILSRRRPVQLTERARSDLASVVAPVLGRCPVCEGRGVDTPDVLAPLQRTLELAAAAAPPVRVEIDQAHCTPETKVRRAVMLSDAGALDGTRILFLGDDDLTSVAVLELVALLGCDGPREITVVDLDPAIVAHLQESLGRLAGSTPYRVVAHDLRDPLPAALQDRFDVVFTDPPYTTAGAELFLSRAVSALSPGAGREVYLAFGSPVPEVQRDVQATIAGLGLEVRSLVPGFNDYVGAGSIGATSAQYRLRTTRLTSVREGLRWDGPLYTGEGRRRPRRYECTGCGRLELVGPGGAWAVVADLKAAGCPGCGNDRFRPSTLAPEPAAET